MKCTKRRQAKVDKIYKALKNILSENVILIIDELVDLEIELEKDSNQ